MRTALTALVSLPLAMLGMGCAPEQPAAVSSADAPPLQLVLEIAGQPHPITVGQPTTLPIHGQPTEVRIVQQPFRTFDQHGVRFTYPADFIYRQDGQRYTLEGRRSQLELIFTPTTGTPADTATRHADKLHRDYQKLRSSREPVSTQIGHLTLIGTRLEVVATGKRYRQDIYPLDLGSTTCILILQDTPQSGNPTPEYEALVQSLNESLEIIPQ